MRILVGHFRPSLKTPTAISPPVLLVCAAETQAKAIAISKADTADLLRHLQSSAAVIVPPDCFLALALVAPVRSYRRRLCGQEE